MIVMSGSVERSLVERGEQVEDLKREQVGDWRMREVPVRRRTLTGSQ
jgi:hypothetical protein